MAHSWDLLPLDSSTQTEHFSCGDEFYDVFLKKHALTNQRSGLCTAYVAVNSSDPKRALGYFTLSTSSILRTILPAQHTAGLPRYERYPTILIGMLARDRTQKKSGLGDFLLISALYLAKESKTLGFTGVELLAANDKLVNWYHGSGFVTLQRRSDDKTIMFIHRDAIP